jgi:hypothetical protein
MQSNPRLEAVTLGAVLGVIAAEGDKHAVAMPLLEDFCRDLHRKLRSRAVGLGAWAGDGTADADTLFYVLGLLQVERDNAFANAPWRVDVCETLRRALGAIAVSLVPPAPPAVVHLRIPGVAVRA